CIARLADDRFVAVSRFCPHSGGDLTGGWVDDGKIVCPLHSLPFDCGTGASPCSSLRPLRRLACRVHDGHVSLSESVSDEPEEHLVADHGAA
ncbi:MAG: Rieske (2Fe-2S) protein, partial [Acidobacteriota bacterium]